MVFSRELNGNYDFVLKDLENLLSHLKPVLSEDGLYKTFLNTPYGAAELFGELLISLKEIAKQSNSMYKTVGDKVFYAVFESGNSWFDNESMDKGTTFGAFSIHVEDYETVYKNALEHMEEVKNKYGKLRALAILKGKMDWNLSFEDYAQLYMP